METSAVFQLYEKPVDKYNFFYDPFIEDSDSSAYRQLCKINVFCPKKLFEKEERIGHNYEALSVTGNKTK